MAERDGTRQDGLVEAVLAVLRPVKGPDARGEHTCWCPFHPDGRGRPPHEPNLRVSVRGYFCHACGAKGSLRELAQHLGIGLSDSSGGWAVEGTWHYRSPDGGTILFSKDRLRAPRGDKTYLLYRSAPESYRECPHRATCPAAQAPAGKRPHCREGRIYDLQAQPCSPAPPRVLYNEPLLAQSPDDPVHLPGGEKCADALWGLGFLSVTNYDGEGAAWRSEDTEKLQGREVVLWLDADDTGRRRGPRVARALWGEASAIKLIDPYPDRQDGADVFDWVAERRAQGIDDSTIRAELTSLVGAAPEWRPEQDGQSGGPAGQEDAESDEGQPRGRPSMAKLAVDLALSAGIELFSDERGEACAAVPAPDGRRILSVSSRDFSLWLSELAWRQGGKALGREARGTAREVLSGIARFEGTQHPLAVRCAFHEGAIWYDLDGRRAVRVCPGSWGIVERVPILFRSFAHQRPMPEPVRSGGDVRLLLDVVNTRDDAVRTLLTGHLVAATVPDIPVAALIVHGIQGSAKTTLLKFVKGCLDPSAVAVRGGVKDQTEYAQAAWQNRAFFFDNLTHVPDWLSDALCRTVTGEGWSKRTLYTDEDSTIFEYRRVVGLSGINLVAERPDLLDRSVIIELEPLAPSRRRDERGLWADFAERAPYIVGGVFDALARAMEIEPDLDPPALPRMADYARWGAAAAEALGVGADAFLAAYDSNVGRQNEAAVEASPIAQAVLTFMAAKEEWSGSATELLAELSAVATEAKIDTKARTWPRAAGWVTRRLKEVLPNLTALGLEVALGHADTGRSIRLRKVTGNAVNAVSPVMAGAEDGTATLEAVRP